MMLGTKPLATVAASIALGVAALTPSTALAHARLVKSDPAARSVLQVAPSIVRLWFNERIEPKFATVTLLDARGASLLLGAPEVPTDDPKRLDVKPPSMAPGVYRLRYRVVSVDGHVIEAEFSFTLKAHDRRAEQPAAVARP